MSGVSAWRSELSICSTAAEAVSRAVGCGAPANFFYPPSHGSLRGADDPGAVLLVLGRCDSCLAYLTIYRAATSEIGLWVAPEYRRAGVGRSAFEDAIESVRRLEKPHVAFAVTEHANSPMARILGHCNFNAIARTREDAVVWNRRF